MNLALNIIFFISLGLILVCLIRYLPRLRAWFGSVRPQKKLKSDKNYNIAVIVPARNESKAIGDFIESVKRQTYNKENFDIHVIVKDDNDPTIAMVNELGGYSYILGSQTCKGDALDFCLKTIAKDMQGKYDAFLIIDADCMMADDYLERMNEALASGRQIIQSKRVVKNYLIEDKNAISLSASCNGMIWTIIDGLGNRYKSDKGITCMTIGTGVMLRADVVEILGGWPYRKTLTEDMELMNDSAIKGFTTFYYEYAVLYLEESTSLKVTNKRRTRWLTGLIDSKRIYYKQLKKSAKTKEKKRDKYFVTALWPVFGYIGLCVISSLFFLISSLALFILGSPLWLKSLIFGVSFVGVIYVSFLVLTIFCMAVDGKHIKLPWWKKVVILFAHPIFYMGYIPIVTKALFFKGNRGWEVIERIDCSLRKKEDN